MLGSSSGAPPCVSITCCAILGRFHNSRALAGFVRGVFFSMKEPLKGGGSGVQQLWNRYKNLTGTKERADQCSPQTIDEIGVIGK